MAGWPPRKNAAFTWYFFIRDNDGDLIAGAAGLDAEVSIDGGAFADLAAAEADEGEGLYSVVVAAGEMNGDVIALICKTSTEDAKSAGQVIYTSTSQIDDKGYEGPRGPGIYLNDAAAHTDTDLGVDGTTSNPVSTIAAARTLAIALGTDRIYFVNNSAQTLADTYNGWEFVGIGDPGVNIVTLGSHCKDKRHPTR